MENDGGTWLHEDIALDFAQWLSVDFRLWCNDRIKELLRTGVATVSNDDEVIARAMQVLNQRLEAARIEKERLQVQNAIQSEQLKLCAPKIEYYEQVLQSKSTYTTTQIAKSLGMSAETLNKQLKAKGVQFYQSGQWLLTSKHQGKGYTATRTYIWTNKFGETGSSSLTVWTERGREFILNLFRNFQNN